MKRLLGITICLLLASGMTFSETKAPLMKVNGKSIEFNSGTGQLFLDEAGRVQVPVRGFAEAVQANVNWDSGSQTVFINKSQTFVQIPIGKDYIEKDGKRIYADTASRIKAGRTYLPLRLVSEALGFSVKWDARTQTATLTADGTTKFAIPASEIPKNKYKVYYYETNHPGTVVGTEFMESVGLNVTEPYMGIEPNNFSATWVGDIEFPQDTERNIDIALSWATASLKIDGRPVTGQTYVFRKGVHRIEVDYTNNWHTIGFLLQFNEKTKLVDEAEAKEMLVSLAKKDAELHYVGVYESGSEDHSLQVDLKAVKKPVILFLSSYSPVNWSINNPNKNEILAVFYNSFEKGGTVTFQGGASSQVVRMPDLPMALSLYPTYDKVGHGYLFENEEFGQLRTLVERISGKTLAGYTGAYGEASLTVPEVVLDAKAYGEIDKAYAEIERLKKGEPQKPSTLFGASDSGAVETWGKQFNKEPIPVNRFRAYYINTGNPKKVLKTELVDRACVQYAWSDFLGVDANDFGVYYVGDFTFEKDTLRRISLAQQWSFTRVMIDGKVVFDETDHNSGMVDYTFTKGTHRIEVEHINDWHTVGFDAGFVNLPIVSMGEAKTFFSKNSDSDTKVYFSGMHSSGQFDISCSLNFSEQAESAVLILNSYEPVHWKIGPTGKTKLKGILLTGHYDGSTVEFVGNPSCEVVRAPGDYLDVEYLNYETMELTGKSTQYRQVITFLKEYGINRIDGLTKFDTKGKGIVGGVRFIP